MRNLISRMNNSETTLSRIGSANTTARRSKKVACDLIFTLGDTTR